MKFEINNDGDNYALTAAVLVYTNGNQRHAFATRHFVESNGARPVIGAGQPFTDGDYRTLVHALAPKERPGMYWNDSRVLAKGLGRILWWSPPKERSLFFKTSSHNSGTFDGHGVAPCPGLVCMGTERAMYVFAFKGETRPGKDTLLHQAPFYNVWSTGQVCTGNAAMPADDQRDDPDCWERMFFGSNFTHPNFTEKDRLTLGVNPVQFWKEMLQARPASFPMEVLVPLKLKVGDLLDVDAESTLHQRPRAQGEF